MYYKYNENTLRFEKVNWVKMVLKFLAVNAVLFLFVITNVGLSTKTPITDVTEQELIVINRNHDAFTEQKLEKEIKRLNFRFPYIVHAQSLLETGEFTSPIFLENHNLFGMKQAMIRANMAVGTNRSHAYYNDWKESILDYALFYATYLHQLKTEDEYYAYLDARYAEANNYSGTLKKIIKDNNLKERYGFEE